MKDNTILLLVTEIIAGAIAIAALCMGNEVICAAATTGALSMLGGHLNGTEKGAK